MTKNKKDDYFYEGKPVHRTSYCAFLDVLGFSDRMRASYKENDGDALLQDFHSILNKSIERFKETTNDSMLYFKSFTDNVLLAHPRFSKDMEAEFGFILWSILEYQFEMALKGFFIRGGLSVGPLFVDENSVYGEALLEAYHLESKVATNPIVVLSDATMKLVDLHVKYYGDGAPQMRHVLKGADGRYFLNYLSECIIDGSEELNVKALRLHKQQIEKSLKQYIHMPTVFAKFSWLAQYHNFFCDSVSLFPEYKPSLRVSKKLASTQISLLSQRLHKNKSL
jgi:hypothetical protein